MQPPHCRIIPPAADAIRDCRRCPLLCPRLLLASRRIFLHGKIEDTIRKRKGSAYCSKNNMGLLKGINPLLTADVLHILRSMGHGDKLCICDCNFPAAQVATHTTSKKHVILTVTLPEALDAICSVFPLDFFEKIQAVYMGPQDGVEMPPAGLEVVSLMKEAIIKNCGGNNDDVTIEKIERFSFYEEAKSCFAVIQCLERRPYGNIILCKGCVGPDGLDLKP